jgi:hypothetical protein
MTARATPYVVQAQEPGAGQNGMQMGLWSGKLKHRMATQGGYSTVDLLNLTALIPDRCGRHSFLCCAPLRLNP